MQRLHPFVQGHAVMAVIVGIAVGALLGDRQVAGWGATLMLAGAIVSSLVCWKWPGFEAPWWKLLPVAIFASPVMLTAIGFVATHAGCFAGYGSDCLIVGFALWAAIACLLPPLGGLAWRWRSRRG